MSQLSLVPRCLPNGELVLNSAHIASRMGVSHEWIMMELREARRKYARDIPAIHEYIRDGKFTDHDGKRRRCLLLNEYGIMMLPWRAKPYCMSAALAWDMITAFSVQGGRA